MKNKATYATLGLSATFFCLAVDAAAGVGAAQWLADLCLTDDTEMVDMKMVEVTLLPLLGISLGLAGIGFWLFFSGDRKTALGLDEPDSAERAGILSAIVLVAAASRRTTAIEIGDIFQIVTGHPLEEEYANHAMEYFKTIDPNRISDHPLQPLGSALSRRRVLAAALLMGCVVSDITPRVGALIQQFGIDIAASPEDVTTARIALQRWTAGETQLKGMPLITVLRGKPLGLTPA